jgi:hypothetical protein
MKRDEKRVAKRKRLFPKRDVLNETEGRLLATLPRLFVWSGSFPTIQAPASPDKCRAAGF